MAAWPAAPCRSVGALPPALVGTGPPLSATWRAWQAVLWQLSALLLGLLSPEARDPLAF
ncbi:hypothetical protein OAO87_00170 [bacterium]|nr:hypothetical protein [bacterium]